MPENDALYKVQYDVKAGHWPENEHQCVVVLTKDGRLYDMTLYSLGLKSGEELDKILDAVADDKTVETSDKLETFDYDDFLGIKLKLVMPVIIMCMIMSFQCGRINQITINILKIWSKMEKIWRWLALYSQKTAKILPC